MWNLNQQSVCWHTVERYRAGGDAGAFSCWSGCPHYYWILPVYSSFTFFFWLILNSSLSMFHSSFPCWALSVELPPALRSGSIILQLSGDEICFYKCRFLFTVDFKSMSDVLKSFTSQSNHADNDGYISFRITCWSHEAFLIADKHSYLVLHFILW